MNFAKLLEQRANSGELGYRFLPNDREEVCLTYEQLVADAYALSNVIRRSIPPGQRVLLVFPAGLEFVRALYACLLANVVAVPLPVPKANEVSHRLGHVIKDCAPAAIFTEASLLEQISGLVPDKYQATVTATDLNFNCEHSMNSGVSADRDVAVLQYTSGSTSKPKGVILSNANLFANLQQIERAFGHTRESAGVIWLPHYHDMGLIGGILQPLFVGFPVTLMSPVSFIQRPLRWLQAIHKYQATTSGGPNFAYELCISKAANLEPHVDLSSWEVAFNGAEPVKASTLEAFSTAFASAGFRRSTFLPCYGLAEATLIVAAGQRAQEPLTIESSDARITAKGLRAPSRGKLVSCGPSAQGAHVLTLRAGTEEPCHEGEVGEVVVYSPSVAEGYWGRNDLAFLPGTPKGVRTGDLGFLLNGELYVTGRLSDLILIRGQNIFPEDIEATMRAVEPLLAQEGAAAFSVDGHSTEELVLVQEVSARTMRSVNLIAIREEVSRLVMKHHGIAVSSYLPVRVGSLVRTSSGKISRFACKHLYEAKKLISLHESENPAFQN